MVLAAGVGAVFLLLVGAGNARASRLRLLVPSVVSFASDGSHYVAWQTQESSPLTVLDTATGQRQTISLPAGCRLVDQGDGEGFTAADGGFLLECVTAETAVTDEDEGRVLDVRTGVSFGLPHDVGWYLLGALYARGNNADEHQVVVDLATGVIKRVGGVEYRDLNRPGAPGTGAICPRLREAVKRDEVEFVTDLFGRFGYEDGLFVGVAKYGSLGLERCNGSSTTLPAERVKSPGRLGTPVYIDLRSGLLSWDTAVTEFGEEAPAGKPRLDVYDLKTGRREEWRPSRPNQGDGWSTHTANTVFWVPAQSFSCDELCSVETSSVYAARF